MILEFFRWQLGEIQLIEIYASAFLNKHNIFSSEAAF